MAPLAVFLISLLILHTGVTSDQLDEKERNALITFISKARYRGFSWKESEPACTWKGVTCDSNNSTVWYLKLPAKSMVGEIPPNTIGHLKNLRILSLRLNGFYGKIPDDLSNLTSLTRLTLYNNSFSGQIPYINSKLLTSFNISFNKLNSSIPDSLSKFPISAFSVNVYLCGAPFVNISCNESYPPPVAPIEHKENNKNKGVIVGISVGSALLLLLLTCSVRKKIYQQRKQQPKRPSAPLVAASTAGTSAEGEGNKLVVFEDGIYSLSLEDLLMASAEVLGEGSGGISYKQMVEEKKTTVVVKRLKNVVETEKEFEATMAVLRKIKNKNMVPLRGYYCSKDEKWLVYDYMPAGSLSARLHGSTSLRKTQLDWDNRMRIALGAAKGLAYLHVTEKVVHGNIKSSNILLSQENDNEALVSDYGLNALFSGSNPSNHRLTGYWAPEDLEAQKVTFKSDVYSFGVLLLELLTGKTPRQHATHDKEGVANFSKWVESIVCKEPVADIFDVELRRSHNMEEMVQLLRIAKHCVSIESDQVQRPTMHDVVTMIEDMWLRPSSDDHSKGYDYTPSTETQDTPSTITP